MGRDLQGVANQKADATFFDYLLGFEKLKLETNKKDINYFVLSDFGHLD